MKVPINLKVASLGLMLAAFIIVWAIPSKNQSRETYRNSISAAAAGWKSSHAPIQKEDGLDQAAFQNYVATFDPQLKRVPHERLYHAVQTANRLQQWRDDVGLNWTIFDTDMGGRSRSALYLPQNQLLGSSVSGGLYKNANALDYHSPWEYMPEFSPNLSVSCLVKDPDNDQRIYMGTGEAQTARNAYRESSGVGAGIFVSDDLGENWLPIPSTSSFKYITDIAILSKDGQKLIYAAVASGYYHGEVHSSPSEGLFRSVDEGDTWEQVLPAIPETDPPIYYTPADIEITSSGKIFVGTMVNKDMDGGGLILSSESGDIDSWEIEDKYAKLIGNFGQTPGRVILTSCEADPNIIYSCIALGKAGLYDEWRFQGWFMLKSESAGESWSNITVPHVTWAPLAWHAMLLQVHPEDPNKLYTGGTELWQSLDGGQKWNKVSKWKDGQNNTDSTYVHADLHQLAFHPSDFNQGVFTSDGGIFLCKNLWDENPRFYAMNNQFNSLQYYACATANTLGKPIYIGGMQDNGSSNSDQTAIVFKDKLSGGDGCYCFIDQDDPQVWISSSQFNEFYFFDQGQLTKEFNATGGSFISASAYSSKSNTLFSNAANFQGEDAGRIMQANNVPFVEDGPQYISLIDGLENNWFSAITASDYPEGDQVNLFLGTNDGRLFKAIDVKGTPEIEELSSADFPIAYISCIAMGASEDTLMVSFSNYGVPSLWLSVNGGADWQNVESNLPDMPIRWALFHPQNNQQVLLATEVGIWSTDDLLDESPTWKPNIKTIGSVRVDMLKINPQRNEVLAATHGRGLAVAHYPIIKPTRLEEARSIASCVYPNPSSGILHLNLASNHPYDYVEVYNLQGQMKRRLNLAISTQYDLSDLAAGVYFLHLLDMDQNKSQVIPWVMD